MKKRKRWICVLLLLVLCLGFWIPTAAEEARDGSVNEDYTELPAIPDPVIGDPEARGIGTGTRSLPLLQDGVYYIHNCDDPDSYLTAPSAVSSAGQPTLKNSICSGDPLRSMWRVKNIGSGRYTLRPMHFTPFALYGTIGGTYATVSTLGYMEKSYGSEEFLASWKIETRTAPASSGYSYYYVLSCTDDYEMDTVYLSTTDGGISYPAPIYCSIDYYDLGCEHWYFEPVTNPPEEIRIYKTSTGYTVKNPTMHISSGQTKYLAQMGYAISVCRMSSISLSGITIGYTNSSNFTATIDLINGHLRITANGTGYTTVSLKWTSNGSVLASFQVSDLIVDPGYCLIRNCDDSKYIDTTNQSLTAGALGITSSFHGGSTQMWYLDYTYDSYGTGSYVFRAGGPTSNYYLGIVYDEDLEDFRIALRFETYAPYMGPVRWTIDDASIGTYSIFSRYLSDTRLAVDGNQNLIAYEDSPGLESEWEFGRVVGPSVALEGQTAPTYCWVAAARMLAKHYYPNVTYTQSYVASAILGEDADKHGGTPEQVVEAINDYYLSTISGASIPLTVKNNRVYSENILRTFFDDGHVVYISRRWYPRSGIAKDIVNHATLIYGCVTFSDGVRFLVADPLPMNQGQRRMFTYNKLFYDSSGNSTYSWFAWKNTVAPLTAYSDNTTDWYFS